MVPAAAPAARAGARGGAAALPDAARAAAPASDADGGDGQRRASRGTTRSGSTRAHAAHARLVLAPALRRAAGVLVPSAHTEARLLARVRGLDPAAVTVTPYGVDPALLARARAGRPAGAVPARRRDAAAAQEPRGGAAPRSSACTRAGSSTGSWWRAPAAGATRRWSPACATSPAAGRIDVAGRVDDAALVALYRGAACLLFPSRAEGFGFPPLEAMACGTPVVAAAAGSLPEVVGDAAPLVEPDDHAGLADAVARVLADPAPWRARGLARAGRFSWARCAEQTVAAYRAAVTRGAGRRAPS